MAKSSTFGSDLIQAMSEALTHASGAEIDGVITHAVDVAAVDAKATRLHLDLTQSEMATPVATSVSGYRAYSSQGVGKGAQGGVARLRGRRLSSLV